MSKRLTYPISLWIRQEWCQITSIRIPIFRKMLWISLRGINLAIKLYLIKIYNKLIITTKVVKEKKISVSYPALVLKQIFWTNKERSRKCNSKTALIILHQGGELLLLWINSKIIPLWRIHQGLTRDTNTHRART